MTSSGAPTRAESAPNGVPAAADTAPGGAPARAQTVPSGSSGNADAVSDGWPVVIRRESDADHRHVREVHTRAFEDPDRVPGLVEALRAAVAPLPPISLVATAGGRVVGHVMLSACRLDAPRRIVDVLSLSPLGVLPEQQGRGIGTRLIAGALAAAEARRVPLVFLEGSPRYYGSRGFSTASAAGFRRPSLRIPDPAFQVARLAGYQPWMTGTFVYSEPFWACDCVGLRDPDACGAGPVRGNQ